MTPACKEQRGAIYLSKKVNAFIDEMKSLGELGANDFELKIIEDPDQRKWEVKAMNVMSTLSETFVSNIC